MYSAIIIWKNNCTRKTQYSFQQISKAPHTFLYPKPKILTMISYELWNVNTLELPSTITAANEPSSSTATTLNIEIKVLEATRVTKAAELDGFKSDHKDLETRSNETKALLDKDEAILQKLATDTQTLLAVTIREKATLTEFTERIDTLLKTSTPLHGAIKKIKAQLDEKVTEANNARQVEATAALRSKVQLECHRSSGKAFIKAVKTWYKFSEWKSTNNNCNIGPQTEAILLVLFDIPCFFSRTELGVFLGYKSPNHNVDGALTKMVEETMLIKSTNKVGTEVYFLGNFGRQSLQRDKLPNVDYRPKKYQASINIRSDNGHRVRNKRQATARTSLDNKQQESSTTKKSSVTTTATKKAKTAPKPSLSSSDKELPKSLANGRSTSEHESEKDADYFSSDDKSEQFKDKPSSDEESKKSDHSSFKTISLHDILNPDYRSDPDFRSV
jgi:hypothetical protein